jgi:predicted translin family RNA/ssDNA-binding protein
MEYMLGIGDLTGELMRVAIHSMGSGDLDKPFKLCNFLRNIYDNFLLFGKISRELNRKLFTLKQSLQKVEAACYTLQVRGSEIPNHMLADVLKNVSTHHSDYTDMDMTSDDL